MRIYEWVIEIKLKEACIDEQGPITADGIRWELEKCFSLLSPSLVIDIQKISPAPTETAPPAEGK